MATKLQNLRWMLYNLKYKKLLIYGLSNGMIKPYDEELLKKLRTIYHGGIPASIILLSDGLTNGHCYDRALLMSEAFLDSEDDVRLIYADIDGLKLNPEFICDDKLYADHCILERITKDGKHLIYDTSAGFIFDKNIYWLMENPKVRKINNKESIKEYLEFDKYDEFTTENTDNFVATMILPMIEMTYGRPNEMYTMPSIKMLQREIEIYKEKINYDELCKEVEEDMKRKGLKNR